MVMYMEWVLVIYLFIFVFLFIYLFFFFHFIDDHLFELVCEEANCIAQASPDDSIWQLVASAEICMSLLLVKCLEVS